MALPVCLMYSLNASPARTVWELDELLRALHVGDVRIKVLVRQRRERCQAGRLAGRQTESVVEPGWSEPSVMVSRPTGDPTASQVSTAAMMPTISAASRPSRSPITNVGSTSSSSPEAGGRLD
jgi:hypothetical protein